MMSASTILAHIKKKKKPFDRINRKYLQVLAATPSGLDIKKQERLNKSTPA